MKNNNKNIINKELIVAADVGLRSINLRALVICMVFLGVLQVPVPFFTLLTTGTFLTLLPGLLPYPTLISSLPPLSRSSHFTL